MRINKILLFIFLSSFLMAWSDPDTCLLSDINVTPRKKTSPKKPSPVDPADLAISSVELPTVPESDFYVLENDGERKYVLEEDLDVARDYVDQELGLMIYSAKFDSPIYINGAILYFDTATGNTMNEDRIFLKNELEHVLPTWNKHNRTESLSFNKNSAFPFVLLDFHIEDEDIYFNVLYAGRSMWMENRENLNVVFIGDIEDPDGLYMSYFGSEDNELVLYKRDLFVEYANQTYLNKHIDIKPDYILEGTRYYSFDHHYFYTSLIDLVTDAQYGDFKYEKAVNSHRPYYNIYQYISYSSKTKLTVHEIRLYLRDWIESRSYLGPAAQDILNGVTDFVQGFRKYKLNPLVFLGHARVETSYKGCGDYEEHGQSYNYMCRKDFNDIDDVEDRLVIYFEDMNHYVNHTNTWYYEKNTFTRHHYKTDHTLGRHSWLSLLPGSTYYSLSIASEMFAIDKFNNFTDTHLSRIVLRNNKTDGSLNDYTNKTSDDIYLDLSYMKEEPTVVLYSFNGTCEGVALDANQRRVDFTEPGKYIIHSVEYETGKYDLNLEAEIYRRNITITFKTLDNVIIPIKEISWHIYLTTPQDKFQLVLDQQSQINTYVLSEPFESNVHGRAVHIISAGSRKLEYNSSQYILAVSDTAFNVHSIDSKSYRYKIETNVAA